MPLRQTSHQFNIITKLQLQTLQTNNSLSST